MRRKITVVLFLSLFLSSVYGLYTHVPQFKEIRDRYRIALAAREQGIDVVDFSSLETRLHNASFIILASTAGVVIGFLGAFAAGRRKEKSFP